MKRLSFKQFCGFAILAFIQTQAVAAPFVEGTLDTIDNDKVIINGIQFQLANPDTSNSSKARCAFATRYYTPEGRETNFKTVAGVGYFERARVTVQNGCVSSVNILDVQQ